MSRIDFPRIAYSRTDVRLAGRKLAQPVIYTPETHREAVEAFSVAHAWRASHFYPMRSVRGAMAAYMRNAALRGDMASRVKRMPSIRRKLADPDLNVSLDKMQDLGGCRAILDDIEGVNRLVDIVRDRIPHGVRREWPYIETPKPDGYRSHHFSLEFDPRRRQHEHYAGRLIELQIRTRLQHSWATSIEAVSLYRGEDLKHHRGDASWLRLFLLAAAEFAEVERCSLPSGVPDRPERVRELRDLNARLNADSMLENIKAATFWAETNFSGGGTHYLLRYRPDHTVKIETHFNIMSAMAALAAAERATDAGENRENVVLVEVDKIDKLVDMYPNYFGDVSLFVSNLRLACSGRRGMEYTVAAPEVVKAMRQQIGDPRSLRRHYSLWRERTH